MSATIIFGSKPIIPSVPNGPHHMYILYTNEAGETRILRGGPEGSSFANAMIGDLKVIDTPYDSSSIDWDANGSHVRSQPIVISSDAEMYSMINLARTEMTRINNEGYDYNLPIVDTLVAGWGGADDQNSNTVVTKLAEVMGLKSLVLNFISANNLHVPGYDATLEHSLFERTTESLYQGLKSAGNSVSDLFSGVKESVGDFFGDTKDFFFNLFGIEVKDQQSNINNSQINNSLLNFSTNLSPTSNNASANPDDFTNGTFLSGGDYTGSIPSNTLNEDGLI
ncbi:MAG: hypothetical protein SFV53_06545, partial [Rickettsiales bacterium]|nr:hypothetical protein [Rickettsiales bacterium]